MMKTAKFVMEQAETFRNVAGAKDGGYFCFKRVLPVDLPRIARLHVIGLAIATSKVAWVSITSHSVPIAVERDKPVSGAGLARGDHSTVD